MLGARTALATATAEARAQAMTAAMESRLEQFSKETKAELEGTPPAHRSATPPPGLTLVNVWVGVDRGGDGASDGEAAMKTYTLVKEMERALEKRAAQTTFAALTSRSSLV